MFSENTEEAFLINAPLMEILFDLLASQNKKSDKTKNQIFKFIS